jgi:hypothetical protein
MYASIISIIAGNAVIAAAALWVGWMAAHAFGF